jgi:hypothetical protein
VIAFRIIFVIARVVFMLDTVDLSTPIDFRLSPEACTLLENRYVAFRKEMRELKHAQQQSSGIPMTVRQLEALVRIAESLARMELKREVTAEHVTEAIRLFRVSTFSAATSGFGPRIGTAAFQVRSFLRVRNVQSGQNSTCVCVCVQAAVARAEAFLDKRLAVG